MKMRRLPEIDLAKLAMIDDDQLLTRSLQRHISGSGSWSYSPARELTQDVLDAKLPLVGRLGTPTWSALSRQITIRCNRGEEQESSNLEVSRVLYDFCRAKNWRSARIEMSSLPIGFGDSIRYWSDVVIENRDGLFIPFFDHRRRNGVRNTLAVRFVFSVQNFWLRERILDLRDARLAIISFPIANEARGISVDFASNATLMPFDELNGRIRRV